MFIRDELSNVMDKSYGKSSHLVKIVLQGRGPGRPRKDGSISRPTTSYRGGAGRGGVRGQSARGGTSNHVLMQQMQHITPPPNAPSATLVPLIKPLVLPSNASTTVTLSSGQAFAHKQVGTWCFL